MPSLQVSSVFLAIPNALLIKNLNFRIIHTKPMELIWIKLKLEGRSFFTSINGRHCQAPGLTVAIPGCLLWG